MTESTFHARANAVLAESRLLMQKFRAERMATSRHKPGRVVPQTKTATKSAKARAAAKIMPVPAAVKAVAPETASILPSRKVQAALAPAPQLKSPAKLDSPVVEVKGVTARLAPETAAPRKTPRKAAAKIAKQVAAPDVAVAELPTKPAAPRTARPKAPKQVKPATASPAEPAKPAPADMSTAAYAETHPVAEPLQQTVINPAPLSALPALGPGMIWRLNQVGLSTVGDLANASPDMLRERLGAVAKLIRVETLIDLAAAHGEMRSTR